MTERQHRTSVWVILCNSWVVFFAMWAETSQAISVVGDAPLAKNRHVVLGVPSGDSRNEIVISRQQYVLGWNVQHRGPAWAGWELTSRQLGSVGRSETFRLDHDLQDYLARMHKSSVKPDEYKGSCLDRGHQVASADRTAILSDNQATFMMSNMLPQAAYLNRVSWASLEKFLRNLVTDQGKELNIYSGAVYDTPSQDIGTGDDIDVPSKNFKIVVIKPAGKTAVKDMRLLVVDFPNVTSKNTDPVLDHEQACYDSQHTARLSETNSSPYWKKFVSDLNTVQGESDVNFSFLSKIPRLSAAELAQLLKGQVKSQRYLNLLEEVTDILEETVISD